MRRLLLLRREQVHTVRWGGKPEKVVQIGPLGERLTPRGSFDEWRETVRGRSVPWDATHIQLATELFNQVQRTSLVRHAETESARQRLLAMLGQGSKSAVADGADKAHPAHCAGRAGGRL